MAAQPQIRSGIHAFWEIIMAHKKNIPEQVIKKLDCTPFGPIIRFVYSGDLQSEEVYKASKDLLSLLSRWSKADAGFKFGESVFKITPEDVHKIFALPYKGRIIGIGKKSARDDQREFNDMYFPRHGIPLTKTMIMKGLEVAISNKQEEHMAILIVQLLLCTFLFTKTGSTMSWTLANLCVDLDGLKDYAWATMVLNELLKSLYKGVDNISGCAPIVMYWFADKTQMFDRIPRRDSNKFTFCRWKLRDANTKIANLNDAQIVQLLTKTVKEEAMSKAFKEALKENIYYLPPEDEVEDPGLNAPSFDLWGMICKEELRRREEEAQRNMIEIISSLNDTNSPPTTKQSDKAVLISKLREESSKFIEISALWWTTMEKVLQEKAEWEAKFQKLRQKHSEKSKTCEMLYEHIRMCEQQIGKQVIQNKNLENKVEEIEKKLNGRKQDETKKKETITMNRSRRRNVVYDSETVSESENSREQADQSNEENDDDDETDEDEQSDEDQYIDISNHVQQTEMRTPTRNPTPTTRRITRMQSKISNNNAEELKKKGKEVDNEDSDSDNKYGEDEDFHLSQISSMIKKRKEIHCETGQTSKVSAQISTPRQPTFTESTSTIPEENEDLHLSEISSMIKKQKSKHIQNGQPSEVSAPNMNTLTTQIGTTPELTLADFLKKLPTPTNKNHDVTTDGEQSTQGALEDVMKILQDCVTANKENARKIVRNRTSPSSLIQNVKRRHGRKKNIRLLA